MTMNEYFDSKLDETVDLTVTIEDDLKKMEDLIFDLSFYVKTHNGGYWDAIDIYRLERRLNILWEETKLLNEMIF